MAIKQFDYPRYLGDGVYASCDTQHIWLMTLEGQRIALDPTVFAALVQYNRDLPGLYAAGTPPELPR